MNYDYDGICIILNGKRTDRYAKNPIIIKGKTREIVLFKIKLKMIKTFHDYKKLDSRASLLAKFFPNFEELHLYNWNTMHKILTMLTLLTIRFNQYDDNNAFNLSYITEFVLEGRFYLNESEDCLYSPSKIKKKQNNNLKNLNNKTN